MKIENIEQKQIFSLEYKYVNDNYITYEIFGKNNFFSGKATFCILKNELVKFISDIDLLKKDKQIKIQDNDSDSYIEIVKIDNLGHFIINLQIGGSHQENFVKLYINTDNIGLEKFKGLN